MEVRESISDWTALDWAAWKDHPDTCLLLISRGLDLMAVNNNNHTVLDMYGNELNHHSPTHARPPLSNEVKEERREILRAALQMVLIPRRLRDAIGIVVGLSCL